jgi:hypothetical protein
VPIIAKFDHKKDGIEYRAIWGTTPKNTAWKFANAAKPDRWQPIVAELLAEYHSS